MTCVIHHGPPGSYKSFGTIQRNIIPALLGKKIKVKDENTDKYIEDSEGRTVVTNIRGLNSLERIEEALGKKLHSDSKIIYVDADSKKGFDAIRHFFHWAPKGSLIAIDEAQEVYSKKRHRDLSKLDLKLTDSNGNRLPKEIVLEKHPYWDGDYDRPESIENAFDQHRHYNWDIYCTTPNISKVHPEIREVTEIAYRHRELGAMFPWKKGCWREFTHDSETSGKSISHYMGSPKEYKADKKIFACYQSTKTGKAKHSNEDRSVLRDPKLQFIFAGIVICITFFIYSANNALQTYPFLKSISSENSKEIASSSSESVDDGRNDNTVRTSTAFDIEQRFNDLIPFDNKKSISDSIEDEVIHIDNDKQSLNLDVFSKAILENYSCSLAGVLKYSKGVLYQIHFEMPDRKLVLDNHDLTSLGYQADYDGVFLYIYNDNSRYMIRRESCTKEKKA